MMTRDPFLDAALDAAAERRAAASDVAAQEDEIPTVDPAVDVPWDVEDLDDDGWFDAAAHGAADVERSAPASEPAGAASLPLDGQLVRATPVKATKPPKASKASRTPRRRPDPPSDRPSSRRLPGRRSAIAAVLILVVVGGAAVLADQLTPAGSDPDPVGTVAHPVDRTAADRATLQAAERRGDYDAAITLATTLGDRRTVERLQTAAAAVLVGRARRAAQRGDLPLARSRLALARRRYADTPGARLMSRRIATIQRRRAARARALRARRAADRRAASAARVTRTGGSAPIAPVPSTPQQVAPPATPAPVRPAPAPSSSSSSDPPRRREPQRPAPRPTPAAPSGPPPAPAPDPTVAGADAG